MSSPVSTELKPSFALPIGLVAIATGCLWVQVWIALVLLVFGLFLLWQTVSLRLCFSPEALDIYRGETLIRRFPYQDWQNWQIFNPRIPILFYFKEVKSIHFLPILFDPQGLRQALEQHVPHPSQRELSAPPGTDP